MPNTELPTDWWTTYDVAAYLDISWNTANTYSVRGHMPPPDRRFGGVRVWKPHTIKDWHAARRGSGRWADRRNKNAA